MPPAKRTPARKSAPRKATPTPEPAVGTEAREHPAEDLPECTATPGEPLPTLPDSAYPANSTQLTAAEECNVPRCPRPPEINGLCGGHYATHRGLADPSTKRTGGRK